MNEKSKAHRGGQLRENVMQVVFLIAACISILAVALICIYLFANGIPAIAEIGPFQFLLGTDWRPNADHYGIFPMILGSIYVTAGAIIVGVPLGLLAAIFMAKFCPAPLYKVLKPAVDLLAGIPSIVYGFFGLMVIVPLMQKVFPNTSGKSILTASILLGIMILPTIIGVSESAIRAVPDSYYEGALALGASHERSVFCHYDCRQPAPYPRQPFGRCAHPDRQHCHGDGLCHRPAPGGPHRHRRGAVCVHPHHQPAVFHHQAEGEQSVSDMAENMKQVKSTENIVAVNKPTLQQAIKQYKKSPFSLFLRVIVTLAAFITVAVLLFLVAYIVVMGVPNLRPSLFELKFTSENASLLPALINTVIMTLMSLIVAVPIGIFSAIYLVEYAKRGNKLVGVVRITAETLSGIPSIVYGLFGFLFFGVSFGWGYSMLGGALTMAIMILPLIMRTTEEALMSVPDSFREGSFGLGAGKLRTVFRIILPSAMPGILSGIILGIGRIVGETAALMFTSGSVADVALNPMDSGRTLAVHMYNLLNEGLAREAAYATAVVLLVLVIGINALSSFVAKKFTKA